MKTAKKGRKKGSSNRTRNPLRIDPAAVYTPEQVADILQLDYRTILRVNPLDLPHRVVGRRVRRYLGKNVLTFMEGNRIINERANDSGQN